MQGNKCCGLVERPERYCHSHADFCYTSLEGGDAENQVLSVSEMAKVKSQCRGSRHRRRRQKLSAWRPKSDM